MQAERIGGARLAPFAATLLLLWAALAAQASVPTSGLDRLKQLARLPQLSFSTGVAYTPASGLVMILPSPTDPREVDDIKQALAGNSSDAPRYARLGRVLADFGQRALAERAYAQAAEFYQQQSPDESRDPQLLVGYGRVLEAQGKVDQAERMLRRAVEVAPQDWKGHAALARFLAWKGLNALVPADWQVEETLMVERLLAEYARVSPSSADAEKARRLLGEAGAAADRAVALGPETSEPYAVRASVATGRRLLEALLPMLGQPHGDARKVHQAVFNAASLPDLQAAARLAGTNAIAWGTVALYEALTEGFLRGLARMDDLLGQQVWSQLPESTRASVRQAMNRLEALAQGTDPRHAAAALAVLGNLQCFLLRDTAGGEATLRRAVALDPAHEGAWESLTFAFALSRNFPPMIEVCQSRLKTTDTARNRVLLAKAYERNNQPAAMLQVALSAQAEHRDNLLANLAAAAALLKVESDDDASRARALQGLIRATQFAGGNPPPEVAAELLFQRSLYFALSGQAAVARASFRQLLDLDPANAEAQEALKALEQTGD